MSHDPAEHKLREEDDAFFVASTELVMDSIAADLLPDENYKSFEGVIDDPDANYLALATPVQFTPISEDAVAGLKRASAKYAFFTLGGKPATNTYTAEYLWSLAIVSRDRSALDAGLKLKAHFAATIPEANQQFDITVTNSVTRQTYQVKISIQEEPSNPGLWLHRVEWEFSNSGPTVESGDLIAFSTLNQRLVNSFGAEQYLVKAAGSPPVVLKPYSGTTLKFEDSSRVLPLSIEVEQRILREVRKGLRVHGVSEEGFILAGPKSQLIKGITLSQELRISGNLESWEPAPSSVGPFEVTFGDSVESQFRIPMRSDSHSFFLLFEVRSNSAHFR